eukprot:177978-Chlamydomonas_euryale.AAC.1
MGRNNMRTSIRFVDLNVSCCAGWAHEPWPQQLDGYTSHGPSSWMGTRAMALAAGWAHVPWP